ncbi:MAG: HAD family phosphatase [Alistipes sp.]
MILDGIKNIVFDLGGVLVDLDKQRCIDAFTAIGFPQSAKLIDFYYPIEIFNKLEKGEATTADVCKFIRTEAGREDLTDEQITAAYSAFLLDIPIYKLRMLRDLRLCGFKIYLLSNTNEIMMPYVLDTLLTADGATAADYFDKIYLSFEMKELKPSPTIFRKMLDDSGMKVEETLFLDDGAKNIDTARAMGFQVYMPQPREDFRFLFDEVLNKN